LSHPGSRAKADLNASSSLEEDSMQPPARGVAWLDDTYLTVTEIAELLGCNTGTVPRMPRSA
jgi:hypothetical protein